MAYTPYVAVAALVATVLAAGLRRWGAAAVAGLSAVGLVGAVAPRALGDGETAAGRPSLRVLTANVRLGRASAGDLVALVRAHRVDVLAVQELTPGFHAALRDAFPHRRVLPRPGAAGTGLYSRLPLEPARARGGSGTWTRALVRVPGGAPVDLFSVHPTAPFDEANAGWWREGLRALAPAPATGAPRVLAGDFNATLDHAELRGVLRRGYRDAAEVVGAGLAPTWPGGTRRLPPVTIDHVLADERCAVRGVRVLRLRGTDHSPVLADLACGAGRS